MISRSLDVAVKPFPALQIFNILFGILGVCWEYPLPLFVPNTAFHRSIAARLAIYPLSILAAALLYQGTNAAIYYLVGLGIYFWAYSEGEVCLPLFSILFEILSTNGCYHRLSVCHGNFLSAPRAPAPAKYKQCFEASATTIFDPSGGRKDLCNIIPIQSYTLLVQILFTSIYLHVNSPFSPFFHLVKTTPCWVWRRVRISWFSSVHTCITASWVLFDTASFGRFWLFFRFMHIWHIYLSIFYWLSYVCSWGRVWVGFGFLSSFGMD